MTETKIISHILTLADGIEDKNLIGNKGAGLVTMHKLGINVPPTLFLTTEACKNIFHSGTFDFPVLKKMLDMFRTDKIAVRSSGVVSMAGMMDTVLDIDRNDEKAVKKAILDVVASWDSPKAKKYRKICKISDEIQLAIVIQPVIRGDKGYSGICFSRNPNTGDIRLSGEYLKGQLGEKLASGEITPEKIEHGFGKFPTNIYQTLIESSMILEKHFKAVQDIEFVNDGQKTYIVQTRNAKLAPLAQVKTLIDLYKENIITLNEFKSRFDPKILEWCKEYKVVDSQGFLFKGMGAVSGIVSGNVVFDALTVNKYSNPILMADITTTDDLPIIEKVKGLITRIGGLTSHPAVICREMNKPCIIGINSLKIDSKDRTAEWSDKRKQVLYLKEGDPITIIGNTGEVWFGEAKVEITNRYQDEVNAILNTKE